MQSESFAKRYPYTSVIFFFFNDTATTEIYTLSLHDALPISRSSGRRASTAVLTSRRSAASDGFVTPAGDRKSTRLNSSHSQISYAVFCLKKKKPPNAQPPRATTRPHHLLAA